ncbi:MAG: YIP1 family protein, partial [Acidobacteriota bacterium]
HGLLLVFGGAPQPYETTFRVMCYSWAVGVFNLLPICGVFIGFVWRIVVQIIGVREAQEVPGGRAAAAVLVPVVFACMCLVMLTMLALSVAGLSQMGI